MHMLALIIPADPTQPLRFEIAPEFNATMGSLQWTQKLVGGYIEPVYLREDLVGYVDEDGIAKGLRRNDRATGLCSTMECGLMPGDYIKGDFVIQGEDPDGVAADLPDDIEEFFLLNMGIELDRPQLRDV